MNEENVINAVDIEFVIAHSMLFRSTGIPIHMQSKLPMLSAILLCRQDQGDKGRLRELALARK